MCIEGFGGKSGGKIPLERPRRKCKEDIKMGFY
jgi:hypothetical protein